MTMLILPSAIRTKVPKGYCIRLRPKSTLQNNGGATAFSWARAEVSRGLEPSGRQDLCKYWVFEQGSRQESLGQDALGHSPPNGIV